MLLGRSTPSYAPKCGKERKRCRALSEQHELQKLLKNLGIGLYPTSPGHHRPPLSIWSWRTIRSPIAITKDPII